MKQRNYETGKEGEKIAENFLSKKDYKLIAKNFHTRFGEIDLIFCKNRKLIFVEVKLKIGEDFGTPEEMINKHKIRQIEMTGQSFLMKYPEYDEIYDSLQIDAICIVQDTNHEILRINHYEDIS
ncbi:hypothetical protein BH10PAT1_BH10PAT1_3640 [soil metagenome]